MALAFIKNLKRNYFITEDETGRTLLFTIREYNEAKNRGLKLQNDRFSGVMR